MKIYVNTILLLNCLIAGIINIPEDFSSIQEGLNNAVVGDSILVASGRYYENILWPSTNNLKLIGSGQDSSIIDGSQMSSVIMFDQDSSGIIDTLTLIQNFSIVNGKVTGFNSRGGGVSIINSNPILNNLNIFSNEASNGGGVYLLYSEPIIRNTIIHENLARLGGGVYCDESSPKFINVTIENDSTDGSGGGMYIRDESSVWLINSSINNNIAHASSMGGGIFIYNSNMVMHNSEIVNNQSYIEGNAGSIGGGLAVYIGSNVSINESIISNNYVDMIGGGISVRRANLTISNSEISLNTSDYVSGGIDIWDSSRVELNNVVVSNNYSGNDFGGILCNNSFLSLNNCTISMNEAEHTTGGIEVFDNSILIIENSRFSQNQANNGGGLGIGNNTSVYLNRVLFDNNVVSTVGGAMAISYNSNSSILMESVTLVDNQAGYNSSGLYGGPNMSITCVNSIIDNEIYIVDSDFDIAYSNIVGGSESIYVNNANDINWGNGLIYENPEYNDPYNKDYTLLQSSPCIDSGTDLFVSNGDTIVNLTQDEFYGLAPDMGFDEYGFVSVASDDQLLPDSFTLFPPYPNPFNPTTTIRFSVETRLMVSLQIYDITGRLVETLLSGELVSGEYEITWNAGNLPSGVYFVRLQNGEFVKNQKVLLLK